MLTKIEDFKYLTDEEIEEVLDRAYASYIIKRADLENKLLAIQMGLI